MRRSTRVALTLSCLVAAGAALYVAADPEKRDLDAAARQSAPGQFVRLSDGVTHYELVGPADGWDPLESTCRHASLSIL